MWTISVYRLIHSLPSLLANVPWKADPYDLHQLDLPHALPSDIFAVGSDQWELQQEVGEWIGRSGFIFSLLFHAGLLVGISKFLHQSA